MLCDPKDPTTALFMRAGTASRFGNKARRKFPDRVAKTAVRERHRQGEFLGYCVIVHFKDKRPPTPLTNHDVDYVLS